MKSVTIEFVVETTRGYSLNELYQQLRARLLRIITEALAIETISPIFSRPNITDEPPRIQWVVEGLDFSSTTADQEQVITLLCGELLLQHNSTGTVRVLTGSAERVVA